MSSETATASDVLDDEREPDVATESEVSETENTEGLDDELLEAIGADVCVAILAGAVGVAAWQLPSAWLVVGTFGVAGVTVMFADDWRIRAVGPLAIGGALAPFTAGYVAILVGTLLAGVVAAGYHHTAVDLSEVI